MYSDCLPEAEFENEEFDFSKLSYEPLRFSTMLAEVKDCTSRVRSWLDEGVLPEDISIVAPDIGIYWPVLIEYLRVEGIPFDRSETTTLFSIPEVAKLVSFLRVQLDEVRSEDLEITLFGGEIDQIKYNEFQKLYSNLFGSDDVARDRGVQQLIESNVGSRDLARLQDFIRLLISSWLRLSMSKSQNVFENLIKIFVESSPQNTELTYLEWFDCFQSFVTKRESTISEAVRDGVRVRDLSSIDNLPTDYLYFIGSSDQALSSFSPMALTTEDAFNLTKDTGFYIQGPESRLGEFQLRWILENQPKFCYLAFAEFDFVGAHSSYPLVTMVIHV